MNPFAIVGVVTAAGYGIYKAATATKEVSPAVEAALAQQAIPVAVQQINAGVPPGIAAQIAAKVVVDAVMVPAGTPTTPYVDPNPPRVEGDPKAGGYYVRWILEHGIGSPRAGLKEVCVRYFATAAERNAFFDSPLNRMGSGTYMPTNFSKGGPDVKSNDFMPGLVAAAPRTIVSWDVTWTELWMLDKTRGFQEINQKAGYDTEAAAMAKANELKAIPSSTQRTISNVKVEKMALTFTPQAAVMS